MAVEQEVPPPKTPEHQAPADQNRYAWLVVGLLSLLLLVNFADKAVVGLAGSEIKRELGLDARQFGIVQSSFGWLFAIGGILGGWLVGKVQARWLLFGISALWALSMLPLAWQVGLGMVIASRVLLGFAEGPTTALAIHVAHSWFPAARRVLPSSVLVAAAGIGPAVGVPVLTWIITDYSWHAAFGSLAAMGAIFALIWLLLGRDGPETSAGAHSGTGEHDADVPRLPDRVPLRKIFGTGTVLGIMLLLFMTYTNTTLKITWLTLYLEEGMGYGDKTAKQLTALPYVGAAVAAISIGVVSAALTRRGFSNRVTRGLLGSSLVLASGLATVTFTTLEAGTPHMVLLVLASCLSTAGYGATFAAVSDVAPAKQRGLVLAIVTAFYSLATIVAPIAMGGFVATGRSVAEGYSNGFLTVGIGMIVVAVAAMFLIDPDRDARKLSTIDST
ncbi:MFS transporter [Streptomyces sp. NPDC047315]|uniref:MFS transporter n=1 Tax=Streptomyces sp. NPDC047315 TaxID=3155142 RepID=UPI0033C73D30